MAMLAMVAPVETAGPQSLNRLPGMRYRTRHLTIAATVPPGQRRAKGRDSGSLGSLAPGAPGCGHGTGGHRVRSPRHGQFGPPPRHRRPAARDQPRLGRGLTGCPVRLGQSGAVSCPTVPSPCEPVRRPTPLGDQVAWDLTGCLGIPKLPVWPGGRAGRPARASAHASPCQPCTSPVNLCGQPLVPTGTQRPAQIFSNHGVLAGTPLRNRTVDLLLTMQTDTV